MMGSLWACCMVCTHCPLAMSHTLSVPSQSALSRNCPNGSSTCTGPLWPPCAAVIVTCTPQCACDRCPAVTHCPLWR